MNYSERKQKMTTDAIFEYLNSKEAVEDLPYLQWVGYTNKYKDTNLCIKSGGWNIEVNGNLKPDYLPKEKNIVNFYDQLAKRIAIALNLVRGKTTEELEEKLKEQLELEEEIPF